MSACGLGTPFNPAFGGWLADLAKTIAADEAGHFLEGRLKGLWDSWTGGAKEASDAQAEAGYRYFEQAWAHPKPPTVFFAAHAGTSEAGDPMSDRLIACVNEAEAAIVFEAWAWQALSMFVHDLTHSKTGQDLAVYQDVCVMSLIPSGTTPTTGTSDGNVIEWMTYETRNGYVEIDRIQESNSSTSVLVTATGFPDENREPTKRKFTLPTKVRST